MFVLRCRQFQFKQYNLVWHGRVFVLLFGLVLVGFYTCFFLSLSLLSYFDVWTNTRAIVLRIFMTNTNTSLSTTTYRHTSSDLVRMFCSSVLFGIYSCALCLCVRNVKFGCVLNVCRVFFPSRHFFRYDFLCETYVCGNTRYSMIASFLNCLAYEIRNKIYRLQI